MTKLLYLGLLFQLLLGLGTGMRAQPAFVAFTDAEKILKGSFFNVSFTLNDARGSKFVPPNFKPFRVVGGPNRTISSSNINGTFSSKVTYTYQLQGLTLGRFKIGEASIVVSGKTLKTKPLTVEVIESENTGSKELQATEEVFVRLETNYDTAYIGQQILLDYKLYTQVTVSNFDIRFEPEYPNSFSQNIPTYNFQQRREIINGKQYITKVMKRVALYPQQKGKIDIEAAAIALGMEVENPRSTSFFFRSKVEMINLQTNPLNIMVLPLPQPQPSSFTGSVGHFEMECNVDRLNTKTHETITLSVEISGDGDEKKIMPPLIDLGANWELYDPSVLEENSDAALQKVKSKKVFEYLLVPQQAGKYRLIPKYAYFNPDSMSYVVLSDTFNLNIVNGNVARRGIGNEDPTSDISDIKPIKNIKKLKLARESFFHSRGHAFLALIPVFIGLVGFGYRRYQIVTGTIDQSLIRQKKARKIAIKRLEPVRKLLDKGEIRASYDAISKAILGYVADKLKIPLADLNKTNIEQKLVEYGVQENQRQELIYLLKDCEQSIFAGGGTSEKAEKAYDQTLLCISNIESSAVN